MTNKLISLNEVCDRISVSRTTINRYRESGNFPAEVNLGAKRFAFVEAEIDQWINDRIAARSEAA